MKLSQLYGKMITDESGRVRGTILGVCFKDGRIDGVMCCDERENDFFVQGDDATFKGEEITMTRKRKTPKNAEQLRLGRAVYSDDGKFLGYMEDVTLQGKQLKHACVGRKKYDFSRLSLGDVVIVKSEAAKAELAAKNLFISAVCDG